MDEFISNVYVCECQLGPKETPCGKHLTKQTVEQCRQDYLELSRDEQDLVVPNPLPSEHS